MTEPTPDAAVVVLTTLASEDAAAEFVRALLDRRLVACGTILPNARSVYRWRRAVEDAREAVVLLKTARGRVGALRAAFAALHPYDVPELLVLPVEAGLPAYLAWVAAEAGPASDGTDAERTPAGSRDGSADDAADASPGASG